MTFDVRFFCKSSFPSKQACSFFFSECSCNSSKKCLIRYLLYLLIIVKTHFEPYLPKQPQPFQATQLASSARQSHPRNHQWHLAALALSVGHSEASRRCSLPRTINFLTELISTNRYLIQKKTARLRVEPVFLPHCSLYVFSSARINRIVSTCFPSSSECSTICTATLDASLDCPS